MSIGWSILAGLVAVPMVVGLPALAAFTCDYAGIPPPRLEGFFIGLLLGATVTFAAIVYLAPLE